MTAFRTELLVLHSGALGDCILTLHFVAALKRLWAGPRVTVAARSSIVRWAQRHGLIDESRSIEEIGAHGLYQSVGNLPEQFVKFLRGFDRVISFLGDRKEIAAQRLAQVLGREVFAIDPCPTTGLTTHVIQQWADQLHGYGLAVEVDAALDLGMPESEACRAHLRSRIGASREKIVLCHPGSGGLAKCCPLEALENLVAAAKMRGWRPVWMIGPDEMERFGPEYARQLERSAPILYEESVEFAADLVCGAEAFIGNDAGMTHVAAFAGVSTIALFRPTDPRVWRPLGRRCSVIRFPEATEPITEWVQGLLFCLDQLPGNVAPDCGAA